MVTQNGCQSPKEVKKGSHKGRKPAQHRVSETEQGEEGIYVGDWPDEGPGAQAGGEQPPRRPSAETQDEESECEGPWKALLQ